MNRNEIYERIANIKNAITEKKHEDAKTINDIVTNVANEEYFKVAKRIIGIDSNFVINFQLPAEDVINKVKELSKTKSTLRKYARSVRYAALVTLAGYYKFIDENQRARNWDVVEKSLLHPSIYNLIRLSTLLPSDYYEDWIQDRERQGKKASISRLPDDWRVQLAANSDGQFRIPMLVALLTGCRPAELEKGINLKIDNDALYVEIEGAKVKTKNSTDKKSYDAGQPTRSFKLANNLLTQELIDLLKNENVSKKTIQVDSGNSVTTFMRAVGKKLWPRKKQSITVYSARHQMAADLKDAISKGAHSDLVSQVLGQLVDKTASYYGNSFQSSGKGDFLPTDVKVPRQIKAKVRERNKLRLADGFKSNNKSKAKIVFH